MPKLTVSEHALQVRVFDVLRLNEAEHKCLKWVYAVPNGGHRHPAVAGKLKAEGVRSGISDICLPFPSKGVFGPYPGAYIEMKAGKNKPTPEQHEFLEFVRENGFAAYIGYSADEVLDFIEAYTNIRLRGRR